MKPNERKKLEAMLRSMPLREPSAGLDRRVLSARPRGGARRRWFWAGATVVVTAATAGVLLVATGILGPPRDGLRAPSGREVALNGDPRPIDAPPAPTDAQDDEADDDGIHIEQVWSALAAADAIVFDDDLRPMRRVHRQVMRRVQWIDPERNVHIEWNIPSEQSVLVPLEYN